MNIKKITIVASDSRGGFDRIYLETDIPSPLGLTGQLSIGFDSNRGYGEEYCRKYFPNAPIHVVTETIY